MTCWKTFYDLLELFWRHCDIAQDSRRLLLVMCCKEALLDRTSCLVTDGRVTKGVLGLPFR